MHAETAPQTPQTSASVAEAPHAAPVRIRLRWRDLDALGHVYHGSYLELLDEARGVWLRDGLEFPNPSPHVIVHAEIDYISEVSLDAGDVLVAFGIRRIGSKSFTTTEEMRTPDGRLISRSSVVIACFDDAARRTKPLTDAQRAALERALVPAEG